MTLTLWDCESVSGTNEGRRTIGVRSARWGSFGRFDLSAGYTDGTST